MYRIGVDVGGTFTDFTILDEVGGGVNYFKVPSTPKDPSEAIQEGIAGMLNDHKVAPEDVSHLGHGTTVATNMVIERRGSTTGLLTTKGFRDVLEIGRQTRPNLYDYSVGKPVPLAAREHRIEIVERIGADGGVLTPLDEAGLEAAVETLKAAGVDAVAVCFLHSYRQPDHEKSARAALERLMPDAYISLSSEVLPEFREYERLSTTVLNAFIGPRMQAYLDRFLARVSDLGITVEPYTIHSNGGLMSVRTVRETPVRTCLSGPAAGVVGATEVAKAADFPNIVTFDVGGTSTDVSLVHGSRPLFASTRSIADYPIKTPMIDIHVIGAGGGSIAWMDDAGALKVGPHSAGAEPGPAAYGRGGDEPTITDANICLHRLNPVVLLDGRMPVDKAAARRVVEDHVAGPLNLDVETAAHGILRIANANMSRAIRSVSTERGYDIKEFALFAYGGAGPLHAAEIAVECGIPTVIVPQEPGTMCARGMLLSDISLDFVRSEIAEAGEDTWHRVCELFGTMLEEGNTWLEGERVKKEDRSFIRHVEARYQGQNFEVKVEMDEVKPDGLDDFLERFRASHAKEYGYDIPGRAVEVVNCRMQAVGTVPKAPQQPLAEGGSLKDAVIERRQVYFGDGAGWVETDVYARARLPVVVPFQGPAVIEEMSSTTVVLPGQSARVDRIGNIVINVLQDGTA
ncbi:MAG: hydantoinase/oxoprolinase family protein [Rhodospirillales bacterium]|jgi:N-methylhydantoinase A|nr:hydantoinase/oxoprolinase family protein [Rhodospirillales bacterium]